MLWRLLMSWLAGAVALWLTARIVPGIYVAGFGTALVPTLAVAVVNAAIAVSLTAITLPFPIPSPGLVLFLFVLNAVLLKLASLVVPGFGIRGFVSAFIGSMVLTVVTALLRHLAF